MNIRAPLSFPSKLYTDCAVCGDGYTPGIEYSCNKCTGATRIFSLGIGAAILIVGVFVLVMVLSALVRVEACSEQESKNAITSKWEQKINSCRSSIAKAIPLTAIKVVLVVWQIVTQVCPIPCARGNYCRLNFENGSKPS